MGLIDWLPWRRRQDTHFAKVLNGYTPIFSQSGGYSIYTSDVVQQAMECIVSEMKKLNPTHVLNAGSDETPVNGAIQRLLNSPNPLMTSSELIEKITWSLLLNYNAFVIPTYYVYMDEKGVGKRVYTGLYPVQPTKVDFIEDNTGAVFIKMRFANSYETTLAYSDVIHVRYRYSVNDYMGGGVDGQPDQRAIAQTVSLNNLLMDSVTKAMKSSMAINGVVKFNSLLDNGKTEAAMKELEEKLKNNESGFLPLDLKADYMPLTKDIKLVDEETLKFIDEKILRNFGVPLEILRGDYTPQQYEAFYQKTLEPIIIQMGQAFSRILFTRTKFNKGHRIKFYPKDLVFMSVDQTLEMIRLLGDSGALYENEKRVALGLRPLPELEGVRMQSLNYCDVEIAQDYQIGGQDNADDEE